ncbi:uncharacterized protein LOC125823827 [Solanum verrucosum]|uniref:uncharacterized protein LOC125823827 n=1 Tax=Solanum verrucosum TaxID=315347 RepID=UPI0020D148EA|nr:uncharacterized protein LOC125823827 [Solanum verrucosum]
MGNLAQLTDMRTSVDELTVRVTACERKQGETSEMTALKAEVADLRKDVDYLKSMDFNSLIGAANDEDTLETSMIPPATTEDLQGDGIADEESDAETDKEQMAMHDDEMIERREESIFRDFPDLVETIV